MKSLKTPGLVLTFVVGAAAGGASCMLPSTHCAYNREIECEANEVCSRCEQGDGCELTSIVDPRCYAYPEEDGGESTTGESSGGPTTPGETGESMSGPGGPGGSDSASATGATSAATTGGSATTQGSSGGSGYCGDGEVQAGEECDDGNFENEDGCLNSCKHPYCGDTFVGPSEDCDDGNFDNEDGCNNACARDRVAFVTSKGYTGDLSGMAGAINACRSMALEAGYENYFDFRPWLSDAENSPKTMFYKSKGRYVLPDMVTVVADDWDDLTDGDLQNAIAMNEKGELAAEAAVWTSTNRWGTLLDMNHCDGWSSLGVGFGWLGYTGTSDFGWTNFEAEHGCGNSAHLYCFEQR